MADRLGGQCILRIEDIDTTRCKPEYESAIYEDLQWLGFHWEKPVRRQSDHYAEYAKTLETLRKHKLVYRCFKTRKEVLNDIARAPHHYNNIYTGPDQPLSNDEEHALVSSHKPYAWRLSLKACHEHLGDKFDTLEFINNDTECYAEPSTLGDVILARKDVGTSYHLACTHDDARQKITHIVRGKDLYTSTHIHRLLQAIMKWPTPKYYHHPLLMDENGKRYAKRDRSQTIREMRESGVSAKALLSPR